ncbi:MAG: radical SAM protein [Synergistaceae bacterium]|nr:radical SAM protein [Synergistaceae bacterium]
MYKLLRGGDYRGDEVRFPARAKEGPNRLTPPVVVWHMTDLCNLRCRHCYAAGAKSPVMPYGEACSFLDKMAETNPPSILFSGGEPLARSDFFELLDYASTLPLRVSLSTNGTLIDASAARFLKKKGVGYVGVSMDGPEAVHDAFRGVRGAFGKTLAGVRNLKKAGVRVGLRFTMVRPLLSHVPDVMKIAEEMEVDRICFYHFIASGRGRFETDLPPARAEVRAELFRIFDWVDRGGKAPREVLTVGNFSDGILLLLQLAKRGDRRAESASNLLERSRGGRSGQGIVSVRWDGALFADQFSWNLPSLGHWSDIGKLPAEPPLADHRFKGRCGECGWLSLCRGNMRARAASSRGDLLDEDPGCVLLDEELDSDFLNGGLR